MGTDQTYTIFDQLRRVAGVVGLEVLLNILRRLLHGGGHSCRHLGDLVVVPWEWVIYSEAGSGKMCISLKPVARIMK